ncbi:MAG: DUF1800 family protein [Acidimicrobiia bacterium]
MYSERERIAHVVRRLGIGANPGLVSRLDTVDEAISAMLDVPGRPLDAPEIGAPVSWEGVDYEVMWKELVPWWLETMASGAQPLVERLLWFFHDHLAVSASKVDHSFVMWEHHRSMRRLVTGTFDRMLHDVARDAAMLWYLDGADNAAGASNENFAREVMELHTVGHGSYSQADVTEMARAFSGWTINEPHWEHDGFVYPGERRWAGVFDPARHDAGEKTIFGRTGTFGMQEAIDLLLDRPETALRVASALYRELVGLAPPPATASRLGTLFGRDYRIVPLVEEIVSDPVFISDEAIRSKVRTPVEKAVTVMQGLPPLGEVAGDWLFWMLDKLHHVPLYPPNPAGFPSGGALLDPARMLGSFELLHLSANPDGEGAIPADPFESLGIYDVSPETRALVDRFPRPGLQLGLVFGSPEFQVV